MQYKTHLNCTICIIFAAITNCWTVICQDTLKLGENESGVELLIVEFLIGSMRFFTWDQGVFLTDDILLTVLVKLPKR
jgi:hypothetical protein